MVNRRFFVARMTRVTTLTVFLLASCGGCEKSAAPPPVSVDELLGKADGYNLLLITLDTTRADYLGCYGRRRAKTPVMDALAQRGVRFEQAFSQVPTTLPSHATLLTGTYPPEHGIRVNGKNALGPELSTLAELFAERNYRTGAFVASAVLNKAYGLDRGFAHYDDDMPDTRKSAAHGQRQGNLVCDQALQWLDRDRDRPFMCWVHFYDPHTPYLAPKEYATPLSTEYDAEVSFADAQIGRLLEDLRASRQMDRTLVVVVGDHGESLGEHGFNWHSLLVYDSILRVPIIFSLPGILPPDRVHSGITRLVDVAPTILDLMGWPVPEQMSGESLVPALAGQEIPPRACYAETEYPMDSFGWSPLQSWVTEQWKYIRAPQVELYDRQKDPGELHNLADKLPQVVRRMESELVAFESRFQKSEAVPLELDEQMLKQLRSLGYVQGTSTQAPLQGALKHPRDMINVVHDYRRAERLLTDSNPAEAIRLMEPAVEQSPESFVLVKLLGQCYAANGQSEQAQECMTRALEMDPGSEETQIYLASILADRGRYAEAIDLCDVVLAASPEADRAVSVRSRAQKGLERIGKLVDIYSEALATDPGRVDSRLALHELLASRGELDESLSLLEDGARLDPANLDIANALARFLATCHREDLRDGARALRLATEVCGNAEREMPEYFFTLAAARAEVGEFAQAVELARRAGSLALATRNSELVQLVDRALKSFQARKPYHQLP